MVHFLVGGVLQNIQHIAGESIVRLIQTQSIRSLSHLAHINKGGQTGPGGRSSNTGVTTTIFGANGFVGSYIASEIAKHGTQIICPHRCEELKAIHLKPMGDLGQVVLLPKFNIKDEDAVRYAISRSQVIINCIGQRVETMSWSYDQVHRDWPARLSKIAAESPQVQRLIHISDMGANREHPSLRMATKALGDEAVLANFPKATIVRPGPVVGIEDYFYNYLIYQLKSGFFAPVIDGGKVKLQPTYVVDVAEAVSRIVDTPEAAGKTYYLGGPQVLTLRQLYDAVWQTLAMSYNQSLEVPAWLLKLMYKPKELFKHLLPEMPLTSYMFSVDYVNEMTVDKVVPKGALSYADLDMKPKSVIEGVAMESPRYFRRGGYQEGDAKAHGIAVKVPESVKQFFKDSTITSSRG